MSLAVLASKNQPPVSRNGQTPETVQIALQPVQFPAGKSIHLIQAVGGFQREQKLSQLVSRRGRDAFGILTSMYLP